MLSGVINTNVNALYALNSLNNTANTASALEQQLSSGLAINSPADNPAGYISAQGFTASQNVTMTATAVAGPPASWSAVASHTLTAKTCSASANGLISCT